MNPHGVQLQPHMWLSSALSKRVTAQIPRSRARSPGSRWPTCAAPHSTGSRAGGQGHPGVSLVPPEACPQPQPRCTPQPGAAGLPCPVPPAGPGWGKRGRRDGAAPAPQRFRRSKRARVGSAAPAAPPQPRGIPAAGRAGASARRPRAQRGTHRPARQPPASDGDEHARPSSAGIIWGKTCPSGWYLKATDARGSGAQKQVPGVQSQAARKPGPQQSSPYSHLSYRWACLHAGRHIYTYLHRTPLACPNPSFPQGSAGGSNGGGARSRPAMPSHHGWLHEAPLARALAAEAEGGGVALLADGQVARRPRLQVARGAAEEAPHQVVEEVPRVQHVDPGVAAAVEAGQEHGDDEGGGCKAESTAASGHGAGGENHHLCREPQLCRHRDASSRAREGLPCPQEHLGQYVSKEELANKNGGVGLSLSNFVFRFFPPEELCSPAQLRRCRLLGVTLEMPWEEAELPPASSAQFAFTLPEVGRREHGLPELP